VVALQAPLRDRRLLALAVVAVLLGWVDNTHRAARQGACDLVAAC